MFCLGKRYPLENEKGCGDLMPKVIKMEHLAVNP